MLRNQKPKKIIGKIVLVLLLLQLAVGILLPSAAKAQMPVDVISGTIDTVMTVGSTIYQTISDVISWATQWAKDKSNQLADWSWQNSKQATKDAVYVAAKKMIYNTLNNFAYDSAVWLASGGKGQTAMFYQEGWGKYLQNTADDAAGTFIDSLAKDTWGEDFNVCEPNLKIKVALSLWLKPGQTSRPDCTFTKMLQSWQTAVQSVNFGDMFFADFGAEKNDFSVALSLYEQKKILVEDKKLAAEKDREEGQGFKSVSDKIAEGIVTPADTTRTQAYEVIDMSNPKWEEVEWGNISSSVLSTFIGTLGNKLFTRLFQEGLAALNKSGSNGSNNNGSSGDQDLYSPQNQSGSNYQGQKAAKERFADLTTVKINESGQYDILNKLVTCLDPKKARPEECVINDRFAEAIRQEVTVRQAIDQGFLDGNAIFGFNADGFEPDYKEGYPYRSLLILRSHQIIPVTWEIAAEIIRNFENKKAYTLNDLIAAYDDKNSPFYHLLDPQWVLKAPVFYCKAEGFGQTLIADQTTPGSDLNKDGDFTDENEISPKRIITRDAYCADYQSCVAKTDEGNCVYGYCTEEKRVWKFDGQSCPQEFNTCQTFTSNSGEIVSYLADSLNYNGCNINNAGCQWYCQDYNAISQTWTCATEGEKVLKTCNQINGCQVSASCDILSGGNSCYDSISGVNLNISSSCAAGSKWWNGSVCKATASCLIPRNGVSCVQTGCEKLSNLLPNGDFEKIRLDIGSAQNWNIDPAYFEPVGSGTDRVLSGKTSLRFYNSGGAISNTSSVSDEIKLPVGDYTLVGWVYNRLNVGTIEIATSINDKKTVEAKNQWEEISFDFKVTDTTPTQVTIKVFGDYVSGLAWFDNFQIYSSCLTNPVTLALTGLVDSDQSKIHFDRDAQACSESAAGCSQFIPLVPDKSLNLVPNSSFEDWPDQNNFPPGWEKGSWGNNTFSLSNDAAVGQNSLKVVNGNLSAARDFRTSLDNPTINLQAGHSYIISFYAKSDNANSQWYTELLYSNPWDTGYNVPSYSIMYYKVNNSNQQYLPLTTQWQRFTTGVINLNSQLGPRCDSNNQSICSVTTFCQWNAATSGCDQKPGSGTLYGRNFVLSFDNINSASSDPIYLDGVQIEEVTPQSFGGNANPSVSAYADYGAGQSTYIKKAPDYLSCHGYTLERPNPLVLAGVNQAQCSGQTLAWRPDQCDSTGQYCCHEIDPSQCANYAMYCQADEVGCDLYTPASGDSPIPGVVAFDDYCPAECLNYDAYKQSATYFESQESLEFFIPKTAKQCTAANVGCDEFTNLDELQKGGESQQYYTYLRQCQKPTETSNTCNNYYTWQGSDESGYQLQVYNLTKSSDSSAPSDAITAGANWQNWPAEWCRDKNDLNNNGLPDCCDGQEDLTDNPFCKQFYAVDGSVSYRIYSNTITCSDDCHPFRKSRLSESDSEAQANCQNSHGVWQDGACVYQAIPSQGVQCPAAAAGCREYKGNASGNIYTAFFDNFEDGESSGWQVGTISSEALSVGGHSFKTATPPLNLGQRVVETFVADLGQVCNPDTVPACSATVIVNCYSTTLNRCVAKNISTTQTCTVDLGQQYCGLVSRVMRSDKSYVLSFWAKSAGLAPAKVSAKFIGGLNGDLVVGSTDVTKEWNHYTFGPFSYNDLAANSRLRLEVANSQNAYFDNVEIQQIDGYNYVIKNSWQTPASCDLNPFVDPAQNVPQFMLGCKQYTDTAKRKNNLKSFNHLCRQDAVGCAALVDTHNSASPFLQEFNAGDTASNVIVSSDSIVYLTNRTEFQCQSAEKGCEQLGQPIINQAGQLTAYQDAYIINNPDNYEQALCAAPEVGCQEYQSADGYRYFKDPKERTCDYRQIPNLTNYAWFKKDSTSPIPDCPVITSPLGVVHPDAKADWAGICPSEYSGCTEVIDPAGDLRKNQVFNGDFLQDADDNNIPDGWNLTAGSSLTDTYLKQTVPLEKSRAYSLSFIKNPTGSLSTLNIGIIDCPGLVSFDNSMVLNSAGSFDIPPDYYRKDSRTGLPAARRYSGQFYVPNDLPLGSNCKLSITDTDQIANKSVIAGKIQEVSLREINVDYQLKDSLDKTSCNGVVNKQDGCVLFNDRSEIDYRFGESDNSYLKFDANSSDININSGMPITDCAGSCNANVILKVKPDRVCGQWLACRTKIQTTDTTGKTKNYCLSLAACDKADKKGECANFVFKDRQNISPAKFCQASQSPLIAITSKFGLPCANDDDCPSGSLCQDSWNLTVDRLSADQLSDYSGYVSAGTVLNNTQVIQGYQPYNLMNQVGNLVEVPNGNFEATYEGGQPFGWSHDKAIWQEGQLKVINDPVTAQKLGLSIPEGNSVLAIGANNIIKSERLPVFPKTTYILNALINTLDLRPLESQGRISVVEYGATPEAIAVTNLSVPAGKDWTAVNKLFKTTILTNAVEIKLAGFVDQNNDGNCDDFNSDGICDYQGAVYYDDINLRPALAAQNPMSSFTKQNQQFNGTTNYISPSCRLFPDSDSPACDYYAESGYHRKGLWGYCMVKDSVDPNICLQWWPVDLIKDDSPEPYPSYQGRTPLYYCGDADFYQPKPDTATTTMSLCWNDNGDGTTGCALNFPDVTSSSPQNPANPNGSSAMIIKIPSSIKIATELIKSVTFYHGRWYDETNSDSSCKTYLSHHSATLVDNITDCENLDKDNPMQACYTVDAAGHINQIATNHEDDGDHENCKNAYAVIEYYSKFSLYCSQLVEVVTPSGRNKAWSDRLADASSYALAGYDYFLDYSPFSIIPKPRTITRTIDVTPFGSVLPPSPANDPRLWLVPLLNLGSAEYPDTKSGNARGGYNFSCSTLTCSHLFDGAISQQTGVNSLRRLFAQSYGVWKWNGKNYAPDTDASNIFLFNPPDNLCSEGNENVRPDSTAGDKDICGVAPNITSLNITPNLMVSPGGFGSVKLNFNVAIDQSQVPLVGYQVDWGDGNVTSISGVSLRDRANEENPYSLSHSYSYWELLSINKPNDSIFCYPNNPGKCRNDGEMCDTTSGAINPPDCGICDPDPNIHLAVNQCAVKPKVEVIDNWNWCNATRVCEGETDLKLKNYCFADSDCKLNKACRPTQKDENNHYVWGYNVVNGNNGCNVDNPKAWSYYSGYVIVGLSNE